MPRATRAEEDNTDAWKREIDDSIKRLSANVETGFRSLSEEVRTLEYQVQTIVDGFGKMEYMLQQQAQQPKEEDFELDDKPEKVAKTDAKMDANMDEFKEIASTLSKVAKTIDETMDGRFLEIKNLINDVELNILSMQKKLILESKIKSKDKEA